MSVDVIWSRRALAHLAEIRRYVALDKPEAATRLAARIVAVVAALREHPHLGRAGPLPGTRELVIGRTPYIVIYRTRRGAVTILSVIHAAQRK